MDMNRKIEQAIGMLATAAEVRRDQWDKAANEDFDGIIEELFEADIEERQNMAGLITDALRTLREALGAPTEEEDVCASMALKNLDEKVSAKLAPYAKYGWIITDDYISADLGSVDFAACNAVNLLGPRNIAPEAREALADGGGDVFRMKDDDDEIYYKGRIVGDFDGFEPLDNYGTPGSGCTSIEYWDTKKVEWRPL